MLHVRPYSPAARDVDELADRYAEALQSVSSALDVDSDALPTIDIYLADLPSAEPSVSPTVQGEAILNDRSRPGEITIWTAYGNEAPAIAAEAEVARALLTYGFGVGQPAARFWDEGLAGHIAAKSGRSPYHAEAEAHVRQLLHDGALPPLAELVAESAGRVSALSSTAAAAFAGYVIDRYGLPRYHRLLHEARTGASGAFDVVYPVPLAIADRDWRRHLEATAGDAQPGLWPTLRRLVPIARPYWRSGLAVLACSLVGVGFSLAMPLSFRFLIDNILARRSLGQGVPFVGPKGHMISSGQEQVDVLILLLTFLGLLYVLNAAARLGMTLLLGYVGESFAYDLRQRLVATLERLPAAYFARRTPSDITEQVVHDVEVVQGVITRAAVPMIAGAVAIVCFAALLFVLEPKLAAITLIGMPAVALIHAARRKGRRAAARERVRRMSDLTASVNEAASAHVLAKLYRARSFLTNRLLRRMEVHRALNAAYARENASLAQSGSLILGLIQVAVLLVGGYMIIASDGRDLAPGALVAFYIVLNQLLGPIGQVSTASQSVAGASASVERAASLLQAPVEEDRPDAREIGPLRDAIRFEGVSFAYPDGKPVLKGLSLTIRAGQTVGFVGPSGAGKSSILELLPRLFETTRGRITWDGVDLNDATLDSLRRQIGMVQQDPLILSGTVYDNIRFGLDGASDEAVHQAARRAVADEVICQLPDGYDTVVGQGGVGLLGGQRQRIALARALWREPSLLILDEATSALDATTQRTVQQHLRAERAEQTIIKVAHRLETVADADVIFVLDGGRLVEQGTHAELVERGGLYARLVADQTAPLQSGSDPTVRLAVHRLQQRAPFSRLAPEALDWLSAHLEPIQAPAGRELYHHVDPPDSLYVLMRGRVELRFPRHGRGVTVEQVEPGSLMGDQSFLTKRRRPAAPHVVADATLYRLSREVWAEAARRSKQANGAAARPPDLVSGQQAEPEEPRMVRSRPPTETPEGRTTSDRPPARISRPRDP